jgi:hypothetical protein
LEGDSCRPQRPFNAPEGLENIMTSSSFAKEAESGSTTASTDNSEMSDTDTPPSSEEGEPEGHADPHLKEAPALKGDLPPAAAPRSYIELMRINGIHTISLSDSSVMKSIDCGDQLLTLFTGSLDCARGCPLPPPPPPSPTDAAGLDEQSKSGTNCSTEAARDDSDTWSMVVNFESEEETIWPK